jgi:hypothetical protein
MAQSRAQVLPAEQMLEGERATARLVGSIMSRRALLQRGAVGAAALSGAGLFSTLAAEAARAQESSGPGVLAEPSNVTPALQIFQIATIAEQLAVTLYENAVANAGALGLGAVDLAIIKAAGIEEQIHHDFFTAVVGLLSHSAPPTTIGPTTFSFPFGQKTFSDLTTFIATQQALEGVFDSAFLAAIRELSHQGQHRAAQIAGQVACIESEHRTLGRDIATRNGISSLPNLAAGLLSKTDVFNPPPSPPIAATMPTMPPDDWAFAPVFIEAVADAPALVKAGGFLSPMSGNSYTYQHIDFTSGTYSDVYANVYFREPTINLGSSPPASAHGSSPPASAHGSSPPASAHGSSRARPRHSLRADRRP